jgi:hypothetical protein
METSHRGLVTSTRLVSHALSYIAIYGEVSTRNATFLLACRGDLDNRTISAVSLSPHGKSTTHLPGYAQALEPASATWVGTAARAIDRHVVDNCAISTCGSRAPNL